MRAVLAILVALACGRISIAFAETRTLRSLSSIAPRIANGVEAQPGQFPWAGVLLRESSNGAPPMQYCGASLVAPNVVMTAAQCTVTSQGSDIVPDKVRVGTVDVLNASAPTRTSIAIYRHPDFNYFSLENNVALIQLNKAVRGILPVKLASQKTSLRQDQPLSLMGWGVTPAGSVSQDLLYTRVRFVVRTDCKEYYKEMYNITTFPKTALCAGSLSRNGACAGDAGDPLIDKNQVQVGIASFGPSKCGAVASIYGYTDVRSVRSWINTKLKEIKNNPVTKSGKKGSAGG